MTTCPTCGHPQSAYLSMRDLYAMFSEADARPVTAATQRSRGRKIAADLRLPVIVANGHEWIARASLPVPTAVAA